MTANSVRLIRPPLLSAERCDPVFKSPRTSRLSTAQANGVRYERSAGKAVAILAKRIGATLERNPWFRFTDANGPGACSPDALLWLDQLALIVVEIKYTWTPTAQSKMQGLYLPVINRALSPPIIRSLIICKTLIPSAPQPIDSLGDGTQFSAQISPTYQWRGQGPIIW
jgi:hypothetical protein